MPAPQCHTRPKPDAIDASPVAKQFNGLTLGHPFLPAHREYADPADVFCQRFGLRFVGSSVASSAAFHAAGFEVLDGVE
jgi:hypothetical protein